MNEKNDEDRRRSRCNRGRRSRQSRGGFLKGIDIKAFLDCYQEWHAFVEGFCEVLCPWPPRCHCESRCNRDEAISQEHHYYMFGRALGILGWLIIATIIKVVFF